MATILGAEGADSLLGEAGTVDDVLYGRGGNDRLRGGLGADYLFGEDGNDQLEGGAGADTLYGGRGKDCFRYTSAADLGSGDVLADLQGEDRLDLSLIGTLAWLGEGAFTGAANELRYVRNNIAGVRTTTLQLDSDGDAVADASLVLSGDLIVEMVAPGVLTGTAPTTLVGGLGADTLVGLANADSLYGRDGNDLLIGGGGNDTLWGGGGADTLQGGAGHDRFVWVTNPDDGDLVLDFGIEDRIGFDFSPRVFIGDEPFSGAAGDLRFSYDAATGVSTLEFDNNSDGVADWRILVVVAGNPADFAFDGNGSNLVASVARVGGTVSSNLADSLVGGANADTIAGRGGDDTIEGGAGNDHIQGGSGHDSLLGGAGSDDIVGGHGNDYLNGQGGTFNDLAGGPGDDTMAGGTGYYFDPADLRGGRLAEGTGPASVDVIVGFEPGNRIALLNFGTMILPEAGDPPVWNRLYFHADGLSIDRNADGIIDQIIRLPNITLPLIVTNSSYSYTSIELLRPLNLGGTTANADSLTGAGLADTLRGYDGADTLAGLGDADTLFGEAGADLLRGGDGADTLSGGLGNDAFDPGSGADRIRLAANEMRDTETVIGFEAGDILDFSAIPGLIWVGALHDPFSRDIPTRSLGAAPENGNLVVRADIDADGIADYTLTLLGYSGGLDRTAPGSFLFAGVAGSTLAGGTAGETLAGGAGSDAIDGLGGADTLAGGTGGDTLLGGEGNDALDGEGGEDSLVGGAGNDTLTGGPAIDRYDVLEGDDRIVLRNLSELALSTTLGEVVTGFGPGDVLDFSGVEALAFRGTGAFAGSAPQLRLRVEAGSTVLEFDGDGDGVVDRLMTLLGYTGPLVEIAPRILGDDARVIAGTEAAETLAGGGGGDSLNGLGGADTLLGLAGPDWLGGSAGNDLLLGDDGADTLNGGQGADTLTGGEGADRFVYTSNSTGIGAALRDVITDFAAGTGELIDLKVVDANLDLAGNQDFSFVGQGMFSGLQQLRYAGGVLQGNITGDLRPDFHILLVGSPVLNAADFVL